MTRSGGETPVTAQTLFRIGSVSKSFTALAIVQLGERGALDLDDPVSVHLSAFEGQAPISLRQLPSRQPSRQPRASCELTARGIVAIFMANLQHIQCFL